MMIVKAIRKSLGTLCDVNEAEEGVWITTACLYPSNASVRVLVQGGLEVFVASDEAGAVHDVLSSGLSFPDPDRRIRHIVQRHGLKVEKGIILSPPVPPSALGAAIALVANSSKEAAHWGYDHMRFSTSQNFRNELARLVNIAAGSRVEHDTYLTGASNKQHRFEHVIRRERNMMVVIDPVMNDASSINAKVVAHLDIKHAFKNRILQRLVYDDRMNWSAADINLLRVGATPVPFSGIAEVLPRLVA